MALPLNATVAIIALIYRIALNLPDMPYSADLRSKQSTDFIESAQQVTDSVDFMLKQLPGYYNVSIREFRYQPVVGTMVIMDIVSTNTRNPENVKKLFEDSIQAGHIGWLAVASEGFEFHVIKVNSSSDGKLDLSLAKPTSTCPDGSTPEYSLHGSTYCWSHSVCPTGTACIQSQCCKTALASTIRKCDSTKWECGDGTCLPYHLRCDNLLDCDDKSDELFCIGNEKRSINGHCSGHEFPCDSGECIPKQQECDREYQCRDGSDETQCEYFKNAQKSHVNHQSETHHQGHQRQHNHQQQHSQQQQQNHVNTETRNVPRPKTECTDQEFRCPYLPYTVCIHYEKLCDGVNDCGDNSDEQKCESGSIEDNRCKEGEYQCTNGQCIDGGLKCNHKYDCEDGTDETVCDYFKESQRRHQQNGENNDIQEHPSITREQYEREQQLAQRERELAAREEQEAHREAEERRREEIERQREEERRKQEFHASNSVTFDPKHEITFKEEYDDVSCLSHEFMCHTGECIDKGRVCDTRSDCLDGSDELSCGEGRHELPPPPPVIEDDWPEDDFEEASDEVIIGVSTPSPSHHNHQHQQHLQHVSAQRQPDVRAQHRQDVSQATDDLQITVYPHEHSIREGRDASFECRARTSDNSVYPQVRWTKIGGPLPSGAIDSGGRLSFASASVSDSGRYACIAQHSGRVAEAYVTLNVVSFGPQELQGLASSSGSCMADEKVCGNNDCVKADYFCDGDPGDCKDNTDEMNCPVKRLCEPNEFRCANDRCIQLMWKCDGDDDCGDGSDEQNCGAKKPGDLCQPTEFKCRDGRQCVPQSFQCDNTNDCLDGSDEIGCVQPTVVEPPVTNKEVNQGDTFQLTCRAVAVPEAYINWRLNWGPVCEAPRCVQESEGGVGTLTVHNAQPLDQGAYTCEAINVKGRVLATPDCIVRIVNIPAPPPPQPPQRLPERISCDPVGAVSPVADVTAGCQCKPLVTGPNCNQCKPGAFHLNEKAPHGCLKCFCFGITDQCRSSDWHRTKEKLFFNGDNEGVTLSTIDGRPEEANFDYHIQGMLTNSEPHRQTLYWTMPQRFKGNKVTAYGGEMAFEVQYSGTGPVSNEPLIVLKGNGITLVHRKHDTYGTFQPDRPIHINVETYEQNYERENGTPASREDLMMVLADLDAYFIRATHVPNQMSTSLGDVSWEIAVDRDTQEGLALEVEQCSCPPGYIGLSCEDCAPGYERSGHGPYLGTCVPVRQTPPPQRACPAGAISPVAGYDGRCQCKPNLTGPNCDQCAANSFNYQPHSPQGCSRCFCNGITNQCRSSNYRRTSVEIDYRRGDQDQLEIGTGDPRSQFSPRTRPEIYDRSINFANFEEANGQTLYWKMPQKFLGDKITAYGGKLKYTIKSSGSGNINPDADVIIKGNEITLQNKQRGYFQPDQENVIEIPITEEHWQRADGQQTTREDLMMALADLDTLLVKLSYNDDCASSSLVQVSLEHAEPYGQGAQAVDVEQCDCPPGYLGTSCEDCAPGYRRVPGPYLGRCERCECNGHASTCDDQYGYCVNCQHNTEGDRCERCRPGFEGDARRGTPHDCRPVATKPPCDCNNHSPRGCDSYGRCLLCEHNTEGYHCETCKKGYYGDATKGTPYDCTPCPCPGTSECYLASDGAVKCKNCPAGYTGDRCDKCAPGYTISARTGGRDCEPIGRVEPDRIQFVDNPAAHLRVEIHPPKHLTIKQNSRAKWTCVASGVKDHVNIQWTKIGSNTLPPHVQQIGNQLIIDSVQPSDAGQYRCTGTTPKDIATDESSLTVEAGQPLRPVVTPPYQSVRENDRAMFECIVPGVTGCEIQWHKDFVGGQLPYGVRRYGNKLIIQNARKEHAGDYLCTVRTNFGLGESNPGKLDVQKKQWRPEAEPPFLDVEIGDPARFKCFVRGLPHAEFQWRREDGQPLDNNVDQAGGYLTIQNAQLHHAGKYICGATDPQDPTQPPIDTPPVTLNVREPSKTPLVPQVDPLQQTVDAGQPAKFRCWVDGNPNAQIRWVGRGNKPLPAGAREHKGELTFPSVSQNDAGEYICLVYDPSDGRYINAPPARLDVNQPSRPPQVDPPEQTVLENTPAQIRCWVPGNPHAHLAWQRRGGAPLPPDAFDDGRGNLRVDRTQIIHEGDYECIATDVQSGLPPQVSQPARVNVRPALNEIQPEQGAPPNPVATPPLITVPRGEPARFHCDAGSDSPSTIHWSSGHNNGPLRGDVHQEGDDLVITSASEDNIGEYICTATNQFGSAPSEPVKLEISDEEIPPTARVEPRVYTGKPGDRHQFTCHVTGLPTPTITWTGPNGGSLPEGVVDLGGGKLDFDDLQKVHEGEYTCIATNPVGEASDKGVIDLSPSLKVITNPTGPRIILTPGEPLEIECIAEGDPDPDVEWLHDPGPERGDLPDDYIPITISEQFLRHPHIGLQNAGLYTCKGSNAHATATKDIYIEVVDPAVVATVSVLGGSKQFFQLNHPSQLICAATGQSIVDKIEWVKVDGSMPNDVEDHNEQGLLHFGTFKPSYAGEYECRGYRKDNLIGTSNVTVYADDGSTIIPTVQISPPGVRVVNEGDSIILDCNVRDYNEDEEVKYKWSVAHGGTLIPEVSKEQHLEIKKADAKHDYGIYKCQVDDHRGFPIGSAHSAIIVGASSPERAEDAKFEELTDAELICPIYAVPGATVTWTRDGDELPHNAEPRGNKLLITGFDDTTTGLYTCTVQIDHNTVEGYVNAKIFVPDTTIKVVLNVSSENVGVGDRVWLDCNVIGDPNAKIEYIKDGSTELPKGATLTECEGETFRSKAKVTGSRLLFNSITEEDTGKYECKAHTSEGTLVTSAVINVGSTKRKRKYRRNRRRHHRRRSHVDGSNAVRRRTRKHHKNAVFGDWFTSS